MAFANRLHLSIATWFGAGRVSSAPGTIGTLAAVPLCLGVSYLPAAARLIVWILLFSAGIWSAGNAARILKKSDPSEIVIDEVLGFQLLTLALEPNWINWITAFFLFRLFDILKLFPADWVDAWSKKQKNSVFRGGFGIIADDLVAAFQSLIVLWILHQLGWIALV